MKTYKESITKEEIYELPLKNFTGTIHLIEEPGQIGPAIKKLKQQLLLGFDTETKPSFKKGKRHKVALLQLSTGNEAFLFRLNRVGLPNELKEILANEDIIKAGAAIHDDLKALRQLNDFMPAGFVELQQHVKNFGIENNGLKKITAIILNFRISKSQRVTNWENGKLTSAQALYAATDAWVCYEIYKKLEQE